MKLGLISDRLDLWFYDENLIWFLWDFFLKLNLFRVNINGVFCFFILVVNIEYLLFNGFVMVNVWVFYIEIFVEGDYFLVYKYY